MIVPSLNFEKDLWNKGFNLICGIDEVGRGSFAGPVMVGAVIFPKNFSGIEGIADSKLLKSRERERLAKLIKKAAISWSVASINVGQINKHGIGKATQMAFRKSIKILDKSPDYILIDAFYIKHLSRKRQQAVRDGDKICCSIAAASIIAKVERDRYMKKLHKNYPQYGFGKHKGYGTKAHQFAINKNGLSRMHRRSFNLEKFL